MDTSLSFPAGTQITVYATLGDAEVALPGRVVPMPAGSGFGFAIDLEKMDESSRERFEAYIKARSAQ